MGTIPCGRLLPALIAASAAVLAMPCVAQPAAGYPTKPVRMIVPFPAGGTTDAIARLIGEKLGERWGQPVIVDNRPGAGGNIGASAVARSDADGYTLMATPPGPLTINFNLYKDLSYDARQFTPVAMIANMPNALVAGPSVKATTLMELVAFGKAHPGLLTYASQGVGTTSHLTAVLFQNLAGIQMLHVPYKGSAPALADMIGSKVDIMFDNVTTSLPFHNTGRVHILAVTAKSRLASLPKVPTAAEAGLAGFESGTWVAIAAPAGTPPDIAEKINRAVDEIVKQPDVIKKLDEYGAQPMGGSRKDMASFLQKETETWEKVIKTANVTIDQ